MNQEWSVLNKQMQEQLKKEATFSHGIDTLLNLRQRQMDELFQGDHYSDIPFKNWGIKTMKKFIFAIMVMMCILGVAACGPQKSQTIISKELGIDASDGREISCSDSHGGFHGDGMTSIILNFSDEKVLKTIKDNPKWKLLPLDETVKTLVYGISMPGDEGSINDGPYLSDEEGNTLVPEIQNGYYILIDRQAESDGEAEGDILNRYSFNFTVGIYDTATNMLYYFRLDT